MEYKATFIQNYSLYEQLDDTKCNNLQHITKTYYVSFGWKLAESILEIFKDTWLNANILANQQVPLLLIKNGNI